MNTEQVWEHDTCPRFQTWASAFKLPVIPLARALHESLRVGLISSPDQARAKLMGMAADPGLELSGANVFDQVVHHSALLEIVAAYLTAEGAWTPASEVDGFEPQSFIMPDGRLRRVILCSSFSELRKMEEIHSWRTVADVCMTGRPMLLNFIVIGQSKKGFRSSPWTQGFIHPENGILRVKRHATEKTGPNPKFTDNWKRVYREQTDHKPKEWLTILQRDEAFDGLVQSCTVDVPVNRNEILADMRRIEREMGSTEMCRSSCFRFSPCPMARLCHRGITPQMAGWSSK